MSQNQLTIRLLHGQEQVSHTPGATFVRPSATLRQVLLINRR